VRRDFGDCSSVNRISGSFVVPSSSALQAIRLSLFLCGAFVILEYQHFHPPRYSKMNLRLITSLVTVLALVILTFRSSLETKLCPQAPTAHSTSQIDGRPIIERRFAAFIAPPELPEGSWAATQSSTKGGFLWVQHNMTSAVSWEVSMAHALHCMAAVRRLVMGKSIGVGHSEDGPPAHIIHCMDYIVQVCNTSLGK
jgi:hypothetical protein